MKMEKQSLKRKENVTAEDSQQDNAGAKGHDTAFDSPTFDFTQKSWSSDFVLNVEGTKLYVSKNILALASPVFLRMFQSDFKESGACELELPGKIKRDVVEFLGCIYPNTMSEISYGTAVRILPLAEEYQVSQLKQRCEKILLDSVSTVSSTEQLCQLFGQACLYNLTRLRGKCVQLMSVRPQEEMEKASGKVPLPVEATNEILKNINGNMKAKIDKLQASCEETTEENETLKRCLFLELKMPEQISFPKGRNWKEDVVVLILAVDELTGTDDKLQPGTSKNLEIWGKSLSVSAARKAKAYGYYSSPHEPWLRLEIDVTGDGPVICTIVFQCVLVGRQAGTKYQSFSKLVQMNDTCQGFGHDFINISAFSKVEQGFICNGKIGLVVQICMSEPMLS